MESGLESELDLESVSVLELDLGLALESGLGSDPELASEWGLELESALALALVLE